MSAETESRKRGLHLLVYDRTCAKRGVGLSTAWSAGSVLYRSLGRIDASFGASSWSSALAWLTEYAPSEPIAEVQYWGHGRWGRVLIADDPFDDALLRPDHASHGSIRALRDRLAPNALVWLRTCEAFGAKAGHDFAARLADTLGARVAGHTFIIGAVQSGLRTLAPGCRPTWSSTEGLAEGTPEAPRRAHGSSVRHPRTVSFLTNEFPPEWFDEDGARS